LKETFGKLFLNNRIFDHVFEKDIQGLVGFLVCTGLSATIPFLCTLHPKEIMAFLWAFSK
jgi:hypothetical protein